MQVLVAARRSTTKGQGDRNRDNERSRLEGGRSAVQARSNQSTEGCKVEVGRRQADSRELWYTAGTLTGTGLAISPSVFRRCRDCELSSMSKPQRIPCLDHPYVSSSCADLRATAPPSGIRLAFRTIIQPHIWLPTDSPCLHSSCQRLCTASVDVQTDRGDSFSLLLLSDHLLSQTRAGRTWVK